MNRKSLDKLVSAVGLVVATVLAVAGALLTWAHVYVHNEVHDQLAAQRIFFPEPGSDALKSDKIGPYLNKYAGQQLTTGAQAKAFADHYIAVHLDESTGGMTYSELSTKSRQNPQDEQLAQQVQIAFRGETLRGMLLNAYAFDTMAQVALFGAFAAFGGAVVLYVLAALGFVHARKVGSVPPAEREKELVA